MSRLDEIEREVIPRTQWQTSTSIKLADLAALVAVARAAADHLRNMDSGDKLAATLAPLLASTEPVVVATARDNAGNAATVVAPLLAEKER